MSIPGVSFQYGNIQIIAPQVSDNAVEVRINPLTRNVRVGVNGQTEEFPADQVLNVTYQGGANGGDTFVNGTSATGVYYGFGGNNHVVGGMAFNFAYLHGDNNAYSATGASNVVFLNGGQNTRITNPANSQVEIHQ
jgi:hypothetical protein